MKRIAFTGDLGFSSKYFRGTYDKEGLLHPSLVQYLSDTDHAVVNVEGCVYKGQGSADKPIVHANPPECIDFSKKINGNIWNLANNHIMDCGIVAGWGENGRTTIRICELDDLLGSVVFGAKIENL